MLRTVRSSFSNASQSQENEAVLEEQNQRETILKRYKDYYNCTNLEFIGELQGYPIGDRLYAENGEAGLEIYFIETDYGHPWIILGNANSEASFLNELNQDEELLALSPIGQPQKITVRFLTENDVL